MAVARMISDRLKEAFAAVVRGSLPRMRYYALFYGRVVKWHDAEQTVDVVPNDPLLPTDGLAGIPFRGPPGWLWTVDPTTSTSVLIGWENGDPARPFAQGFASGAHVLRAVLNADQAIIGGADGAEPPPRGTSLNAALSTFLNALASACTGVVTLPQVAAAINAIGPAAASLQGQLASTLATNTLVK